MIAKHRSSQQNLWGCNKCGVFIIQHWGLGTYYKSKTHHINGWIPNKTNEHNERGGRNDEK